MCRSEARALYSHMPMKKRGGELDVAGSTAIHKSTTHCFTEKFNTYVTCYMCVCAARERQQILAETRYSRRMHCQDVLPAKYMLVCCYVQ